VFVIAHVKFVPDLEPGDIGAALWLDGADVKLAYPAPGSPADRAKLTGGDILVAIDGKPVIGYLDASSRLYASPGKPVSLRVRGKDGKERTVSVDRAR
jgi:C-terminal processing protease CtpA/Prc